MRTALVIVCFVFCLCACDNETQSKTSVETTQEGTRSDDPQLPSDSGQEQEGQDSDATDSAPPDSADVDVAETDATEPTPVLACPDVGLDTSAGTLYYVCDCGTDADPDCVPGDDDNDGSAATPWRSYDAARQAFGQTLSAGDALLFCRGGVFSTENATSRRWVNDRCRADAPCVVRDYTPDWGSGDEELPRIITSGGDHAFAFEDGGAAHHEEGVMVMNLRLESQDGGGSGVWFYNDIDDVLLCNLEIDGFGIGVHLAGSNDPVDDASDGRNDRIVLRLSRITNNADQGWLGSGHDSAIEHSEFDNNGFAREVFNHNIYLSGEQGLARNMRVVGNELYRSAIVDGQCRGVSLVVHGEHEGLLIEGNSVREDPGAVAGGCWGIAVDTGYDSAESFRDIVIRGNTVMNVGNTAIGVNACQDCLIENNVVLQEEMGGRGISVPVRDRAADDLPMERVTVRNNSVVFLGTDGGHGISVGGEGMGHRVVSNAVYYGGDNSEWNCFDMDLASSAYDAVDHNLCYYPSESGAEWENDSGDLAAWQSVAGLDANSHDETPGFTSVTAPFDLRPAAGSALIDAGHPSLSAPKDIAGDAREGQPDIGAHEAQ